VYNKTNSNYAPWSLTNKQYYFGSKTHVCSPFEPPFWGISVPYGYGLRLYLVGKRGIGFLLTIIDLFFASSYG